MRIKTIIAVLLALCLAAAPLTAFAKAPAYIMGDVNSDGRVTASDARKVLRVSAKLDGNVYNRAQYDADGDGSPSAKDARAILRVSAKLASFSIGFDEKGMSHAVKTFASGKYSLTLENEGVEIRIVKDGDSFYLNGMGEELNELDELFGTFAGIYKIDGKIYIAFADKNGEVSVFTIVSKAFLDGLSGDGMSFEESFDEVFKLIPTDADINTVTGPVDEMIDGTTYNVYTAKSRSTGSSMKFYTDDIGAIKRIHVDNLGGLDEAGDIDVKSFTNDFPANFFAITTATDELGGTEKFLAGQDAEAGAVSEANQRKMQLVCQRLPISFRNILLHRVGKARLRPSCLIDVRRCVPVGVD